ncbi:hypothetical protein FB45DRAFT_843339 [Roridomyces roridus]|uniref:BTB domain-containing protein n=1 Tax=Roridomyces roridus TaxID=1738132 RepID=A0AAD7B769_9AGAR|nr:hypothetical protein FB45DRAFT_843339 [Roridomyces roridus]
MQVDNTPHRIPELWFDDGSIVIQAENTQFRVHRSILAARSPVFKDMLSFPQPPQAEAGSESVEGCLVVRLHDSPAEVTVFLKAIFDSAFFMEHPSLTEFETVVGVLRLSHKYDVGYLRRRALIHLSSAFSTTLSRWDKILARAHSDEPLASSMELNSWAMPRVGTLFAVLMPLVGEVGAVWILPHLFYYLSSQFRTLSDEILLKIWTNIRIDEQITFLRGHDIQGQSMLRDVTAVLRDTIGPDCRSTKECAQARLWAIDHTVEMTRTFPSVPLEVWREADWHLLEERVCWNCQNALREKHRAARQVFWDKLPVIYGLPSWEELEKMKIEAIGNIF